MRSHRMLYAGISDIEMTRSSLVRIIEESWEHVNRLVPKETLVLCEDELKDATSLLVLATVRKSADDNPISKSTVEGMFKEADINQDGQVTFSEWYDWLGSGVASTQLITDKNEHSSILDPMISALSTVLGHAVCTLKIVARQNNADPSILSAAFIAGGTMAGVMDSNVCNTMLSRLSSKTKELVTLALTLEAASTPAAARMKLIGNEMQQIPELPFISSSLQGDSGSASYRTTREKQIYDVVQTVDLSAIPLVAAPSITDPVQPSVIVTDNIVTDATSTELMMPVLASTASVANAKLAQVSNIDNLLQKVQMIMEDIVEVRSCLRDLDDKEAGLMRSVLMQKGDGRQDVMGLALALRATRLQHANKLPSYLRQQIAIETLQLWAPISYQVGLANQTPELEVHSYVLLFPQSFGNFISWFSQFRPIAKNILNQFCGELESRLAQDESMQALASVVTLQSRLKTAPAAFKKMVRGAKQRQELYDMLGMRVIVSDKLNSTDSRDNDNIAAVWRVYSIISSELTGNWREERSRFKDYITTPKPSGYQSLHVSLLHVQTGVALEIQIRTSKMHNDAEYGRASHTNYKALLLPPAKD